MTFCPESVLGNTGRKREVLMKIVSRNYRHWNSGTHWLIRDESESPGQAVSFLAVTATGVTFRACTELEKKCGCTTVAVCEDAQGAQQDIPPPVDAIKLYFAHGSFYTSHGHRVQGCKSLHLNPDGSIFAHEAEITQERVRA